MQVDPTNLAKHWDTRFCKDGEVRREKEELVAISLYAALLEFKIKDTLVQNVDEFKYLGCFLSYNGEDNKAIQANLRKARAVWARFLPLLRVEGASPQVSGAFYRAVILATLLYGSELWNLNQAQFNRLNGFHIRACWGMAKEHTLIHDRTTGAWAYPSTPKVLKEVHLRELKYYLLNRREPIFKYLANRPIWQCVKYFREQMKVIRKPRWWDQEAHPPDKEVKKLKEHEENSEDDGAWEGRGGPPSPPILPFDPF